MTDKKFHAMAHASIAMFLLMFAHIQASHAQTREYNVPAQPATTGITEFARQAGIQILVSEPLVRGKRIAAVTGSHSVPEALSILLEGTGLVATSKDGVTYTLTLPAADESGKEGKNDSSDTFRMAEASVALEEVVVTAQKRSERLQDVPVSVSAVSGESLEAAHATSLADYAAYVPSLQVISFLGQPGQVNLALRGITTGSTESNQSVAIYVDDVPVGSSSIYAGGGSAGIDLLPYDVERIEVLEGPQGTLYGASALGGLLKYVTREPDLHQTQFRAGLDVSDVHNATSAGYGARASANVPLIDGELGLSASVSHNYVPGYINNVATDRRSFNSGTQDAVRTALLWTPTTRLSVEFSALFNRSPFNGAGYVAVNSAPGQPVLGRYDNTDVEPDSNNITTQLYVARLRYDAGWANLTSVSSYSRVISLNRADGSSIFFPFYGDNAEFATRSDLKKLTQEIRLASPEYQTGNWMTGVFFTNERATSGQTGLALIPSTNQPDPLLSPLIVTDEPSHFNEVAAFANATYRITGAWDISAGLRESHNEQSVNESAYGALFGTTTPELTPFPRVSQNKLTYSVSSSYHLSPDRMVYARVATGYRPGGANKIAPDASATFGPDTTTNYEVGLKSEWLGRRLVFNLTEFYIDWKNTQVTGVTPLQLTYISNAGAAISKGTELATKVTPLRGLSLGLNLTYTDAFLTVDAPGLGGRRGDPLPSTPKFSGSTTLRYEHSLLHGSTGDVSAVWRYVGARNTAFPGSVDVGGNYLLSSYSTLDLSAGMTKGIWSARLFVRNATDRYAYLFVVPPGGPDSPSSNVILQPRTVGLSLDVRY